MVYSERPKDLAVFGGPYPSTYIAIGEATLQEGPLLSPEVEPVELPVSKGEFRQPIRVQI